MFNSSMAQIPVSFYGSIGGSQLKYSSYALSCFGGGIVRDVRHSPGLSYQFGADMQLFRGKSKLDIGIAICGQWSQVRQLTENRIYIQQNRYHSIATNISYSFNKSNWSFSMGVRGDLPIPRVSLARRTSYYIWQGDLKMNDPGSWPLYHSCFGPMLNIKRNWNERWGVKGNLYHSIPIRNAYDNVVLMQATIGVAYSVYR